MSRDLDRLRQAAKHLRRDFARGDADASRRVAAILPHATVLRHADALHILAREAGAESWPKLKFASELASADRATRAERLKYALYLGQHWRVDALLSADPALPDHHMTLAIALYDVARVRAALEADPSLAIAAYGPRRPILHLAFSQYHHHRPDLRDAMIEIAEMLVAHGADVNDAYPSEPDGPHMLSALYGALGHANNVPLARWLLERGANPDDYESLYHATELGHHDGLRLLREFNATTAGTNALARMLDFDDLEGARLLLEMGADPNETVPPHPSGEPVPMIPALHQAARRGRDGRFARLLVEFGARGDQDYNGHGAYALARIMGNRDFATALEELGLASPLTPLEQTLADCADGTLHPSPIPPGTALTAEAALLPVRLAGDDTRLDHLKALLAAGLPFTVVDEMELPPLHIALWQGQVQTVTWLLRQNPDLTHFNAYGGDALGTLMHGADNAPKMAQQDHVACLKLLRAAGVPFRAEEMQGTGSEEMLAALEDWQASRAMEGGG
ncbi:MAG: ankyrin repeat domain-containing protein [Pseudomonadota bacterium]